MSQEMTGVVDALDGGELMAVPLDLVDAGGAEVQPVERGKRDVEGPAQQYFYRRYVAYHQHCLTVVVSQEPVTSLVDPLGGVSEAFTARRCPARDCAARRPLLRAIVSESRPG